MCASARGQGQRLQLSQPLLLTCPLAQNTVNGARVELHYTPVQSGALTLLGGNLHQTFKAKHLPHFLFKKKNE